MAEKIVEGEAEGSVASVDQLGDLLKRPATYWQRRVAALAALGIMLAAVLAAQYGGVVLIHLQAFLPITITLIVLCEAVTGYLLLSQYVISRQPALLVLGMTYLFGVVMAACYLLAFPGVFAPYNPFGATEQTPAWIWVFWVCGYAFWIFVAVLVKHREPHSHARISRKRWLWWLLLPPLLALALVYLAVRSQSWLPPVLMSSGKLLLPGGVALLSGLLNGLVLLAVVWRSNMRRVFDLFLFISVLAMFGYAVLAIASPTRFSLAWYMAGVLRTIASGGLLVALLWEVGRLYSELQAAHQSLTRVAQRDGLTGIFNRSYLEHVLGQEFRRAARSGAPLSVVLVDVDHFKAYNDGYGHQQGDACLRAIAKALESVCQRSGEFVARYGGEEFMLVMPGSDMASGQRIAESARQAVLTLELPAAAEGARLVSISAGVASHSSSRPYAELEQLIAASDAALYRAKDKGRNRVEVASVPAGALSIGGS